MIEALARHRRRRANGGEAGFTLIELLVVIVILGVLAAVVVFAVGGVGDKGKAAAAKTDVRTIRTAEEADCAKNGTYGAAANLVPGFLSEMPTLHKVEVVAGGPCGNTNYAVTCNPTDAACGPDGTFPDPNYNGDAAGQWRDLTVAGQYVPPPTKTAVGYGRSMTKLTDGRILLIGVKTAGGDQGTVWESYIFDPAAPSAWTFVGDLDGWSAPDYQFGQHRVSAPIALPGGKAIVKQFRGYALFDGNGWTDISVDWQGAAAGGGQPRYTRWWTGGVILNGPACGAYCGRVLVTGQADYELGPSLCGDCYNNGSPNQGSTPPIAEVYDPVNGRFDAIDCPYDANLTDVAQIGNIPIMVQLQDGRVMLIGAQFGFNKVMFFDASELRIDNADPGNCDGPSPWTVPIADPSTDPDAPGQAGGSFGFEGFFAAYDTDPVVLPDGRVVMGANDGGFSSPQIYNPNDTCTTGTCRWTLVTGGPCAAASGSPDISCEYLGQLSPDGTVYVATGLDWTSFNTTDFPTYGGFGGTSAVYRLDTTVNPPNFVAVGSLQRIESGGAGAWINGRLLVAGNNSAEIYSP